MGNKRNSSFLYYFILSWHFVICANATFTKVPKDVEVEEGQDVEMPCAFKAISSAPMSLEIQWWYLPMELQISAPSYRVKVTPREATKISTVRILGNAISHRLSLSRVKKEDEGVYECRVLDLWADEAVEFMVHAVLQVRTGDGMVAEEAVSHIQNRWLLRNTNTVLETEGAGRATLEPNSKQFVGQRSGEVGRQREPQQAQSGLLPSISATSILVAKSSASSHAVYLRHRGSSVMSNMDALLCITLLSLHQLLTYRCISMN